MTASQNWMFLADDAGTDDAARPPALALCEQAPAAARRSPVLYIHGFTFSSELSVFWRIEGGSWADAINDAGFSVWGLDFAGFGRSGRYIEMASDRAPPGPPLGGAADAVGQVERAVRHILRETGAEAIPIVAHSRGTIVAGLFAARRPELVERLCFFGPLAERRSPPPPLGGPAVDELPSWRLVTVGDQQARFVEDVPVGHAAVLDERHFAAWAAAYLSSDPTSPTRDPPSVKVPSGPLADAIAAWSGRLAYDPARLHCPLLIVRGEWDSLTTDADAAWLMSAAANVSFRRDVKLGKGTHLMLFEQGRHELRRVVNLFLRGELS